MLKYSICNYKVIVLFFFVFHINNSYAYFIDMFSQPDKSFIVRGRLDRSDLILDKTRAWGGVMISYYAPGYKNPPSYWNKSVGCTTDRDQSLRIINENLANAHLTSSTWFYFENLKSYTDISCSIDNTTSWRFSLYTGEPIAPGAASCKITAPLNVDFGTVQVGDNNKVIEKQVTIKCDKKTAMRLTLQGDNKTNLLTLSDTVIKLGVDGDAQTKDYNVEEGKVTTANLMFTLSDTGDVPGVKKGYALLISEIP